MKESPMARVNTFLNFQSQTGEVFTLYSKIFETEVTMLSRFSDMPAAAPGELPSEELDLTASSRSSPATC
jgi:uncharacterized glyoxalase superfamily protein PhnB